jgi:hypothetical protein
MAEPFNKSMEEIASLTDRQIAELCFPPRDSEGRLIERLELPGEDAELTKEEQRALLFGMGAQLGVPTPDLEAAWKQKYPDG